VFQEFLESHDAEFNDKEFEKLATRCEPENENPHAVVEISLTTRLQIMDDCYMDRCLK
jgi:hypothetical protein